MQGEVPAAGGSHGRVRRELEGLVHTHRARWIALARRSLPDPAEAEEAVQDAFVSAVRFLHRFEGRSQLSTWLHQLVVNAARMRARAGRRRLEAPGRTRDAATYAATTPEDWTGLRAESPGVQLARERTRACLRDAIQTLPERHQTVLRLRDFEQLSVEEAGRRLALSPAAVKMRTFRAHRALRAALEPLRAMLESPHDAP